MTKSRVQLLLGYLRWLIPVLWIAIAFVGFDGVTTNQLQLHQKLTALERECDPEFSVAAADERSRDGRIKTTTHLWILVFGALMLGHHIECRRHKQRNKSVP